MGHARDVDAAGSNVGCYENADVAVTEGLQGALALALALVAVDGGDLEANLLEMLGQLLCRVLGAQENHGAAVGVLGQRLLQEVCLVVLAGDEVDILLHLVGRLARRRDGHLDRILQEVGGQIGDRFRHGGREKQRLALVRDHLGDLAQVMDEAEVQHLVGFVEHQVTHGRQANGAARDQVKQATGRRDENVGTLFQLLLLLVDRCAADDGVDLQR